MTGVEHGEIEALRSEVERLTADLDDRFEHSPHQVAKYYGRMRVAERALNAARVEAQQANARAEKAMKVLSDLDRCNHGRHEGDACGGCGDRSLGNPKMAENDRDEAEVRPTAIAALADEWDDGHEGIDRRFCPSCVRADQLRAALDVDPAAHEDEAVQEQPVTTLGRLRCYSCGHQFAGDRNRLDTTCPECGSDSFAKVVAG
jgi:hypothetical protein